MVEFGVGKIGDTKAFGEFNLESETMRPIINIPGAESYLG